MSVLIFKSLPDHPNLLFQLKRANRLLKASIEISMACFSYVHGLEELLGCIGCNPNLSLLTRVTACVLRRSSTQLRHTNILLTPLTESRQKELQRKQPSEDFAVAYWLVPRIIDATEAH